MLLLFDAAGAVLLALFVLAVVADVRDWWPCTVCGDSADHVRHFLCVTHGTDCWWHHPYAKAAWPFVVLVVLDALLLAGVVFGFVALP